MMNLEVDLSQAHRQREHAEGKLDDLTYTVEHIEQLREIHRTRKNLLLI